MKSFGAVIITSATVAMAAPHPASDAMQGSSGHIEIFPTNVTGSDKNAFPHAPGNLDPSQKAFLEKYQPLSDKAFDNVQPVNQASFAATGFCYSDFPCRSVNKAAVTTIGDKEEIERDQVSAILDQLTSNPEAKFGNVVGNVFNGLKITNKGAVLDIMAPPGTIKSDVLAGMVFDMFKLQSDDISTNSIRATQAKTDGKDAPFLALCLYPEGADSKQTYNFCVGNELDGSHSPNSEPAPNSKRGFLDGLKNVFCHLVDAPIVC